MQIRQKLTFQFIGIVAFILLCSSLSIYFFSADYRQDDFYNRLLNKASNTAKLLIEVEEVDANLLKKIEKDNPVSLFNERLIIFNYKDEILYDSDEDAPLFIDIELLNKIRLDQSIRVKQGEYEILGFLYTDKYDRFVVVIGAVDIYGLKKLKYLRTILMIVFSISIVLVFIAGRIYAGRALMPILKVIEQVDTISITSLNLRVKAGNEEDEIAKLALTFNKMLERLEVAFNIQKNFIANASHEIRTPLTAITGQLDVALIKERTQMEYRTIILSVLEDIKNLNSISNRLLLLAQASSETAKVDYKHIRIDDIIWQVRTELLKVYKSHKINVTIDENLNDAKQLTVIGNDQLIKTAISNLMDNACKYNNDNSILVNIGAEDKFIIVQFINSGKGIDNQDIDSIFEPFYRGKNAVSVKGHGIGLSLADRIIKLHEGTLHVSSILNDKTNFSVRLPLKQF